MCTSPSRSRLCLLTLLTFLPASGAMPILPVHAQTDTPAGQGQASAQGLPDATWELVSAIQKTLGREQWDGPVLQQSILEAARSIYRVAGKRAPGDLSLQAAGCADAASARRWLDEVWRQAALRESPSGEEINERIGQFMVSSLAPASMFISAKEHRVRQQLRDNQYVGIGIQLSWNKDRTMITKAFPGGPAQKAGMRAGDFVMEIDGTSTEGWNLARVVDVLRGPLGSSLTVGVENRDGSPRHTLHMTRDVVPIASVEGTRQHEDGSWQFRLQDHPSVAYFRVVSIKGSTAAELRDAAQALTRDGVRGAVLDLSRVHDADLHHAQMLADVLVGQATLGQVEFARDPSQDLTTRGEHVLDGIPISVIPPEQASGAVMALLSGLDQRPDTVRVGSSCRSPLLCYASFELADGQGAIDHLAYARFVPPVELQKEHSGIAGDNALTFISIPADVEAEGTRQAMEASLRWLRQQESAGAANNAPPKAAAGETGSNG